MSDQFVSTSELLTLTDAAKVLGVSRQRVQQMKDEGKFPSAFCIGERTWILLLPEVLPWKR